MRRWSNQCDCLLLKKIASHCFTACFRRTFALAFVDPPNAIVCVRQTGEPSKEPVRSPHFVAEEFPRRNIRKSEPELNLLNWCVTEIIGTSTILLLLQEE